MASISGSDEDPAALQEIYTFAIQLGKDAGQILLDGLARRRTQGAEAEAAAHVEKLNAVDIVTQTDNGTFVLSRGVLSSAWVRWVNWPPC